MPKLTLESNKSTLFDPNQKSSLFGDVNKKAADPVKTSMFEINPTLTDSAVPSNSSSKNKNPFISGDVSLNNPFLNTSTTSAAP